MGAVMGGTYFMLADFAFAVAANHEKMDCVSLHTDISFLGAAKGEKLIARAVCVKDGVTAIYQGFKCNMALGARPDMILDAVSAETLSVLQRGGITSMSKPFFTIFICFYFAATAELAGTMEVLLDMIAGFVKNTWSLVLSTGVAMVLLECVCGSSTPSTAIAGPLFKKKYEDMGLHSLNLAREIEDFGTGSTAFIPWSSSCQLYIGILGLNAMTYLKYSYMNWFIWAIALFYAATGICIKKLDSKPEEVTE